MSIRSPRRPKTADAEGHESSASSLEDDTLELTVLVPTRNERDNIAPLLERLDNVSRGRRVDVLFVDDSTDDTPQVIRQRAQLTPHPVTVLHRPRGRRHGGLGSAVRTGLSETRSEWVCVMDADLQHPPELVDALFEEAKRSGADVVVATRYGAGGGVGDFSIARRALSRGSVLFARVLFPLQLRRVSDPMSGFFLVRRSAIDLAALRPQGFKILLEILLGDEKMAVSEVPFVFGERHAGASKASLHEGARYVRRLIALRVQHWNASGKATQTIAVRSDQRM